MSATFVDIVEDAKQLSIEEKQELRDLLDNYLIEERREEIFANFEQSKQENPVFSIDLNTMKEILDD